MQAKLRFPKWIGHLFAIMILGVIFFSYFAPDMMVEITNSVWAMCGW